MTEKDAKPHCDHRQLQTDMSAIHPNHLHLGHKDVEGLARILLRLEKASHLPMPNYRERKSNTVENGEAKNPLLYSKISFNYLSKADFILNGSNGQLSTREHVNVSPHPVVLL